jgi:hypothetical protein
MRGSLELQGCAAHSPKSKGRGSHGSRPRHSRGRNARAQYHTEKKSRRRFAPGSASDQRQSLGAVGGPSEATSFTSQRSPPSTFVRKLETSSRPIPEPLPLATTNLPVNEVTPNSLTPILMQIIPYALERRTVHSDQTECIFSMATNLPLQDLEQELFMDHGTGGPKLLLD